MTSEPRAWVRPDGTLVVLRRREGPIALHNDDEPIPSDWTPLVAAPKVDGDDPRVAVLAEALGWGFAPTEQVADATRAEARDLLARLDAAAPVAREDTASPDEDVADPCIEDALGTCHAPGHWHEGQRRRSASPTVAPDAQRAAPTRDEAQCGSRHGTWRCIRVGGHAGEHQNAGGWQWGAWPSPAVRYTDGSGEARLRGGDADGSGEDEDLIRVGQAGVVGPVATTTELYERAWGDMLNADTAAAEFRETLARAVAAATWLRRVWRPAHGDEVGMMVDLLAAYTRDMGSDVALSLPRAPAGTKLPQPVRLDAAALIARLAAAAGVSPDSEDVVRAIEAAIRAGREPEVVTGDGLRAMHYGSRFVLADDNDQPQVGSKVRELVDDRDYEFQRRYLVLHRAPEPPPRCGEVVTGDRAVTAPIDTTLRHTTAAVVALRTVNGWSLTGWTAEADPEHHVRVNTWRVVEVGEGGGETGE